MAPLAVSPLLKVRSTLISYRQVSFRPNPPSRVEGVAMLHLLRIVSSVELAGVGIALHPSPSSLLRCVALPPSSSLLCFVLAVVACFAVHTSLSLLCLYPSSSLLYSYPSPSLFYSYTSSSLASSHLAVVVLLFRL
jgi:hypothetical protein